MRQGFDGTMPNFKRGGRAWGYAMRERGTVVELYYERGGARVRQGLRRETIESDRYPRSFVARQWRLLRDEWREWISGNDGEKGNA